MFFLAFSTAFLFSRTEVRDRYELRGRILQSDGKPFRNVVPAVFIHGSITPFVSQTLADPGGQFKFKNLPAGMYTLIIAVPEAGQLQQSLDVGPSFADAKGRLEVTFRFDSTPGTSELHTVVASQLSVPVKARDLYQKARARLGKHDVAGAVEYLKKATDLAPQYAEAWNNLGTIAYQTQDYRGAERYFREALSHEPNAFAPLVNLGGALLSQGRAKEAQPINLQAVKVRPDDSLAHSQLGQTYYLLGQLDDAERHLKQAKVLDPGHFSFPQLVLAELYKRRQDYNAMAAELEEFLRRHPDSPSAQAVRTSLDWARTHAAGAAGGKN
ncbi:MAG: tetratricopeptide repeat protein [Acidobacteria bacterium]|nr:tetratricopeptide repeat protein [Acidobacteriota bacterium]